MFDSRQPFDSFWQKITMISDAPIGTDTKIIIYACGLLISVPFLILTIAAYVITPKLRDVHGKALCHYCGCLALAFTTLAITQLASTQMSPEVCFSIGKIISKKHIRFWKNANAKMNNTHLHLTHLSRKNTDCIFSLMPTRKERDTKLVLTQEKISIFGDKYLIWNSN